MKRTRRQILSSILDYALITLGAAVCGAAMGLLMVPNEIVAGGVTGLAVVAYHVLGVPTGLGMIILNLPILWLGWKHLGGRRLFTRSLVGILAMMAFNVIDTYFVGQLGTVALAAMTMTFPVNSVFCGAGIRLNPRRRKSLTKPSEAKE